MNARNTLYTPATTSGTPRTIASTILRRMEGRALRFARRFPTVLIALVIVGGSFALAQTCLAAVRAPEPQSHPVAGYATLLGQPVSTLRWAGFSCRDGLDDMPNPGNCFFSPNNGPVRQVIIRVEHGRAQQVNIIPREGTSQHGDLVSAWRRPVSEIGEHSTVFSWAEYNIVAMSLSGSSSYRNLIDYVIVGDV